MFRVDIYTAVKSSSNSKTMGKIQDIGQIKGTRHETEVKAITEALSRLNQSCEVHIHCEDTYVVNIIDIFLPGWAGNGFKTAKEKPVAEGWQILWKKMQGHLIKTERGRHTYSDEIRKMMEET